MSNSSLVNYTKISPYKNVMSNKVNKKITIHHMAGNLSVEVCGNVFQSSNSSANYGVASDGRIGLYVEEKDRSWASSSYENDSQAVTIEVANDICGGDWHVSDKALAKTIDLCVDICKRNNIAKLNWTGDKSGNLTCHYMFASTACPGPYLKSKMSYIANEVNKKLSGGSTPAPAPAPSAPTTVTVAKPILRNGSTGTEVKNLQNCLNKVINAGLTVDGIFGNGTETALRNFQKKYGLTVDGIYGSASEAKMKSIINGSNTSSSYTVKVTADLLNVRKGPGTQYAVATTVKKGQVYTIVETSNGFGKLKSGAGWIALQYTVKC